MPHFLPVLTLFVRMCDLACLPLVAKLNLQDDENFSLSLLTVVICNVYLLRR